MATGGAKLDTSHGHPKSVAPTLFRMGKIFVKKVQKVLFTMVYQLIFGMYSTKFSTKFSTGGSSPGTHGWIRFEGRFRLRETLGDAKGLRIRPRKETPHAKLCSSGSGSADGGEPLNQRRTVVHARPHRSTGGVACAGLRSLPRERAIHFANIGGRSSVSQTNQTLITSIEYV